MTSIADVYVTVLPETSKISKGIEKELKESDKHFRAAKVRWEKILDGTEAEVEIKVDSAKAKAEIQKVAKDQKATVDVDANTAAANAKINAAARGRTTVINIKIDHSQMAQMGAQAGQVFGQAAAQNVSTAMSGASSVMSTVGQSVARIGIVGAVGIAALAPALTAVAGAAAAASTALALIPAALAGIGAGAGVMMIGLSGITDAFEAVSGAAKTAGKDAADHASKVTSAHRSVTSAARSLNSAIRSEEQAQKDVARARRDALHELQDINDELRNGAIDETQAQIDLQKAREELATGTFESSTDYQQAQLNVIKAEQRLKEAHEGNIDLQQESNDKRAKGVEGADAVVAAEERLAAAQEGTANAQTALAEAQTKLAEANNEVSTSAQKAADAMGGLSPNAQALVNTLVGLQPVWEQFRNSIQDPLTADLGPVLTDSINAVVPAIQPGLVRIAEAFNAMFKEIGVWLQDPENLAMLEGIVNNIATAFEKLVPAVQPMATAFGKLVEVGSGFLPGLAEGLANAAIAFGDFITKSAESGALQQFIQTGLDTLAALGPLLPQIVNLFEKLVAFGVVFTPILVKLVEKFLEFWSALTELWTILTKISPVLNVTLPAAFTVLATAADLVAGAVKLIGKAFEKVKEIAEPIIKWLSDKLQPVADVLNTLFGNSAGSSRFGPAGPSSGPWQGGGSNLPTPVPPGQPYNTADRRGGPVSAPSGFDWNAVAQHESGGNWSNADTGGNGHYGGLQFSPETWAAYGGKEFAGMPHQATREQQMIVADRTAFYGYNGLAPQGLGAWEVVTKGQVPGVTAGMNAPTAAAANPAAPGAPTPALPSGPTPSTTAATSTQRIPYGMPLDSDSGGYGGGGVQFPQWVYDLGAQFNVKPSTYPGHQDESGQNRGIDWVGTNADLQRFAEYLEANPSLAEQVIFSNPETGEKTGMAGGQKVGPGTSQPGYYKDDWGGHETHVHTRFSMSPGGATGGPTGLSAAGDEHTIALDPNIPPGQRAPSKSSKGARGMGEQLGQDIVTGIMDVFGFGDVFKSPLDFEAFKGFKGIMGFMGGLFGQGQGSGTGSGSGTTGTGGGGGGGSMISNLLGIIPSPFGELASGSPESAPGEFIPGVSGGTGGALGAFPNVAGAQQGGNVNSGNFNVNIAAAHTDATAVGKVVETQQAPHARQGLRNQPHG